MAIDILEKFAAIESRHNELLEVGAEPFGLCMDEIISPSEAMIAGRKVILFGTNNYLGLTFDEDCIAAAIEALKRYGTGTTGSLIGWRPK